MSEEHHLPKQA